VLEQRIGRLDRIGRKGDVHIHIPYVRGTAQEVLFRWYDEGFDAFRRSVPGADIFHELMGDSLRTVLSSVPPDPPQGGVDPVNELVEKTREESSRILDMLEKGRDRLLEINGARAGNASERIAEIHTLDEDYDLEDYLDEVFDRFGLEVTETSETRGRLVVPGERMLLDAFPGIPEDGLPLTFDRDEALAREDLAFLSIDHPVARAAVDLVLEDEEGQSAFVAWAKLPAGVKRGFALEAVFVLSASAPGALHLDRFLPPTPVRTLVDAEGESLGGLLPALDAAAATGGLQRAPTGLLEEHHALFERMIPKMLEAARSHAAVRMSSLKRAAHKEAEERLLSEAARLRSLRAVNPAVTEGEIASAETRARAVMEHVTAAELRLDAVRLVMMGDPG
jgi:ATP-dependent helicase HepA